MALETAKAQRLMDEITKRHGGKLPVCDCGGSTWGMPACLYTLMAVDSGRVQSEGAELVTLVCDQCALVRTYSAKMLGA